MQHRLEHAWGNAARVEPFAKRAAEIALKKLGTNHPATAMTMLFQANAILRESSERDLAGYTVDLGTLRSTQENRAAGFTCGVFGAASATA